MIVFWWVGIIEEINEFNIKVRFIYPHGPAKYFLRREMISAGC